jgi:type I restriction enzyme M protein
MITTENFKDLLACIGFEQAHKNNSIWLKSFPTCELRVDFNNKTLVYPENKGLTVNERQTCNFSAPENFVVFECVTRLLSKGYRPEHIELEPKWKLGHGASGGRADLLVKDNNGKPFLIIECKTWGGEFESEWKNMTINGGQLFSYAQQIKSTQFLCLYTSTLMECKCIYENRIVTLKDNIEYLKSLKDPLAFSGATDVQSLYKAWHVTYNHEYETNGIFEDSRAPYEIGKLKHTGLDLQEISHDDIQKKYHEFATILRQHNISGRENAFDKLINLFLAKIVDELQNADSLMFYWRGVAFDNYYDLQDRIQRLYRDGMQKFLNEEVTYIDKEDIKKAFWLFKNDPDATREKIEEYFRQLKFYTNNDFAFLDVHNQNLFFQNATVLLKIVRMLQDIKLKTDEQNQFLGDLFEGFLDQGVKQSEGQFFTPTPIVKFLVSSLPLQKLIDVNADSLKVIDYACGAGHFLNEYATQIRPFLPSKHLSEYYEQIFGIEKEYRLSKVAKVSSFMYGQKEIQIVYADALAESSAIQNNSFKVLVSNPPYSVKGFLETLTPEERASFELYKEIESKNMTTNNSIEVFFVERAKQLLAPGGVAAIILPSSLVSNSGAVYTKTREIILKYFDVVAIVEFGSGTFGKTGTNTLALFMRRKDETPELAEHYLNRVNAW